MPGAPEQCNTITTYENSLRVNAKPDPVPSDSFCHRSVDSAFSDHGVQPLGHIYVRLSLWIPDGDRNDASKPVAFVVLFDGIQTVGLAQGTFIGYLGPFPNFHPPVGMLVDIFFASFSVLLVHCAFVYRVWLMSNKRRYMTIVLAFGGIEMTTAALLDILIAIAMALYLSRERSDFLWTNMLISKLITYFVGAGALTRFDVTLLSTYHLF
ncbi:hypothetical protein ONZ45_g9347 [Pleurotus djamor]|nr:hypothetical protein ONZ45_g9347 [Pleurotus djamor]